MSDAAVAGQKGERIALLKVLGPIHVWALGVGIVLVGEFMGWNFSVAKGGAYGSLIACWIIGLLLHVRGHDRLRSDLDGRRRRWPVHAGETHHRAADGVQRGPVSRHGVHDARGGGCARGGRPHQGRRRRFGIPGTRLAAVRARHHRVSGVAQLSRRLCHADGQFRDYVDRIRRHRRAVSGRAAVAPGADAPASRSC